MIVLSLISNVLLLEEAAAENNPAAFFPKGILGVDVNWNSVKPGPVKLTTGFVAKRKHPPVFPHATKMLFPKQRAWNELYSQENVPVIFRDNGTYHSIVRARESVPCNYCCRARGEARGERARSQRWLFTSKRHVCVVQSISRERTSKTSLRIRVISCYTVNRCPDVTLTILHIKMNKSCIVLCMFTVSDVRKINIFATIREDNNDHHRR